MTSHLKSAWHVLIVAIWINVSETVRWILYGRPRFAALFASQGRVLPEQPINNVLWVVWGILIAVVVYALARRFPAVQAAVLAWVATFVVAWIALWNMAVLPLGILPVAVPLSFAGVFVAALIARKLRGGAAA